jgi:hypothetical protein
MDTRPLNLDGLPEPIARGLEIVAEMARQMAKPQKKIGGTPAVLPAWPLGVIGSLTREEIYGEYSHHG